MMKVDSIFYAPQSDIILPILPNFLPDVNFTSYYAFILAFQGRKYDYDWYLFLNDRLIVNPFILRDHIHNISFVESIVSTTQESSWFWTNSRNKYRKRYWLASLEWRQQVCQTQEWQNLRMCRLPHDIQLRGSCDFWYIPHWIAVSFTKLAQECYNLDAWFEICVPSILYNFPFESKPTIPQFGSDRFGHVIKFHLLNISNNKVYSQISL
jgi:hypothetical protein